MESYNIGFAASNISATISNETSSYSTGAVNSSSFHLQEYNGASSILLDNEERDIIISSLSPGYGLDAGLTGSKHTIFGIKSQYTPLEAILTAVLLLSIIVVTIVGNILVCLAVFLVRKLRRPCNYLLVSLAVSDLCVAILVMPMAMMYEILGRWNFGPVMCDMWVSFDVLSCTASILNLCMISVDRYFAITKPLEYGVKRTPRRMIICVSFVWLGAACISLPPLLILGNEHEVIDGVSHCVVCQNFGYQIYATLGSFYIPLTVMIVVYYKIFCAARRIVLEERKAQSHLESNHCYLQISVKNGDRPPESKLATDVSSFNLSAAPATALAKTHHQHHRASTTSTATTCSVGGNNHQQNSIIIINNNNDNNNGGVYGNSKSRPSNESQCPMLQTSTSKGCQHSGVKNKLKLSKGKKSLSLSSTRLGARTSGVTLASNSSTVSHTKKLRFQLAKERKASTTLGIIMSAFTICWLPFFVLALVRPFLKDSKSIPSSLSSLFLWLGYANSLLNPIIYATLNRDFRKPFQQILFFRCGSLNHMMREEFYHSQYGDPDPPQHFYVTNSSPEKVAIQNLHIRSGDDSTINRDPALSKSSLPIPVATCVANESFL